MHFLGNMVIIKYLYQNKIENRKKLMHLLLISTMIIMPMLSISFTRAQGGGEWGWEWKGEEKALDVRDVAKNNPVRLLETVKGNANKSKYEAVQYTELDKVSSTTPRVAAPEYTITNTLNSAKEGIRDYLQYVMYIWISGATIFLIRNAFKLVTSWDREKQMWIFKKNLTYIIIWIVLMTWFFYLISAFTGIVNLIAK